MSSPIPPSSNSDWHLRPQASYPGQSNEYRAQPNPEYQHPGALPPQPYQSAPPQPYQNVTPPPPYQNAYQPYAGPQQVPQYQMPVNQAPQGVNVNIYNSQNAYPQAVFDPYAGKATAVLTLGIISLIAWIIPFIGSLGSLICSIVGIALFFSARQTTTRRGSAITGLVFCIIALGIALIVIGLLVTSFLFLLSAPRHITP